MPTAEVPETDSLLHADGLRDAPAANPGPFEWLKGIVESAGVPHAEELSFAPETSVDEAWLAFALKCEVPEDRLACLVAESFGLAVANLAEAEETAAKFLTGKLALKHRIFPLRADYSTIVVATSDPTNLEVEQDVAFAAGRKVEFEIAPPAALEQAIAAVYSPEREIESFLDTLESREAGEIHVLADERPEDPTAEDVDAAPVVKLTNMIVRDAILQGASDIHLQPHSGAGVVRFRVDGVLRNYTEFPLSALRRVISRIKVMGELDITNRLRPQDGRARVAVDREAYDLRISTVPTREAEKAVIRILDPNAAGKGLEALRILPPELERMRRMLNSREGIVVVTGPTGSGKTTTLYGALQDLASPEINIMTVEDPVEYELPGLTQIQVEEKQGLTFASALRSILRQDPDVVFVGEIRDSETAEIALQASMTGHVVLATLHTNDAVGAIPRLADLGLDANSIAGALRGSVAQRLARTVCSECSVPAEEPFTREELEIGEPFGVTPVVRAVGCKRCGGSGYRGRIPFVEVLVSTPEIEKLVMHGSTFSELTEAAVRGGMRPLHEAALERVKSGETTLEEFHRVIGEVGEAGIGLTEGVSSDTPAARPAERRRRVLVVDDDGAYRTIAGALLKKEGYDVTEVKDGSVALELFERGEAFDLMVLDLDMPEVGGREVLAQVRAEPATVNLPVIVLTGTVDADAEVDLLGGGADDYLRKPMEPERFVVRVKSTLRRCARG